MAKYKVKLYEQAFKDLDEIFSYICYDKQAPQNAKNQTDRIKAAILGLESLPQSHQDRTVGIYANKGYKQLVIDNYLAIFKIDEKNKTVYIVTIIYQGRNI
ncbi:MAG: type II toxin-antitoxin system RelE/ParE family toxin [Lachnospiraceae bacterium]|nr:type II toxin-antitoxin system RelE/ParE family toxin [Lachnospiraceae bacterium]